MSVEMDALEFFGYENQIVKCIEELSELTQILAKVRNDINNDQYEDNICEEIADVQIMINQMKLLFPNWETKFHDKIKRLKGMLK